jgi:adenosylcobinamide-GDP ribazoletransferase
MASLILAIRFLTIVPVPGREARGPRALGRAAWWFPVVGLGMGAGLVALDRGLSRLLPPFLLAAAVWAAWKVLTGGIHLDGLADCLDGLAGRDPAGRLKIMRDSRIGVLGATGLVLFGLLSLTALAEFPPAARWRLLLVAPAVGRLMPLLVGPCFPPATPGRGTGAPFLSGLSGWAGLVHLSWTGALAVWLFGVWGLAPVAAAAVAAYGWAAFLASRLGGLTGDALGSAVEVGELAALIGGASLVHLGLI